jgi:hypothetical protein
MSTFAERPKVVIPELSEVAAAVRNTIGKIAIAAADTILKGQHLPRRANYDIGNSYTIFGTQYEHERVKYVRSADRRELAAFPGQQLALLTVLQEELTPRNRDVYQELTLEDAARYVVAQVVTPTGKPSGDIHSKSFGIGSQGEIAVPQWTAPAQTKFLAPAEHAIRRDLTDRDDAKGLFIGGFEDSLAIAHSVASAVNGVPTDDILALYRRLTTMEQALVVPRQAYTAAWEATTLPDLTRPPQS